MKLRILCNRAGPPNVMRDSPMWSWACRELGADIRYYLDVPPNRIDELAVGCDVAVYTIGGECSFKALRRIRERGTRLVCALSDGGCHHGHALYKAFADEDVFDAVVNLDGNPHWPHRPQDWTAFGLFDPLPYAKELPRVRKLGYKGASGVFRDRMVHALGRHVTAEFVESYAWYMPYQKYADWMLGCRAVVNTAETGSGVGMHVKGRVNEAALAGCLLFETKGSPTSLYLTPGEDYLEYETAAEIVEHLARPDFDEFAAATGARMKSRMLKDYGPEKFWDLVIGKAS